MFRSSHTQAAPLSPPFHGAACFCIANPFPNRLPSIGATATTAAGGGNRESLLGQRPARRKCFLKHEADAGGRNPALSAMQTERLQKSPSHSCAMGFFATSQSASQTRPGCDPQHPLRALKSTCVLLAAAPTATPCFRHRRRSSLLPLSRGAYSEMDLQYKNRQRRGKEEKAALPVYENS